MAIMAKLVLQNRKEILDYPPHHTLQYLGTFNPQHIGHRIAVQSALEVADDGSEIATHLMGTHPEKPNLIPYDYRFSESERRFYCSSMTDNLRVTQIDLPGGTKLASTYPGQMGLLADLCGDDEVSWLVGSDKILLDAASIKKDALGKAAARLASKKTHAYVIFRKTTQEDSREFDAALDFIDDRFGTKVTLVNELHYDCEPASSSRIRELRISDNHEAADNMEFYTDLRRQ
jgi:nicotinic acid mononucleotide adenylyltransferase